MSVFAFYRNDLTYYIDKSGFLQSKRHISSRSEMVVTTNCISRHRKEEDLPPMLEPRVAVIDTESIMERESIHGGRHIQRIEEKDKEESKDDEDESSDNKDKDEGEDEDEDTGEE